jgi:hypothetical protein
MKQSQIMLCTIAAVLVCVACISSSLYAQKAPEVLPDVVKAAWEAQFPDLEITSWMCGNNEDGANVYSVFYQKGDISQKMIAAPDGRVVKLLLYHVIAVDRLPWIVSDVVADKYSKPIAKARRVVEDDVLRYEVLVPDEEYPAANASWWHLLLSEEGEIMATYQTSAVSGTEIDFSGER